MIAKTFSALVDSPDQVLCPCTPLGAKFQTLIVGAHHAFPHFPAFGSTIAKIRYWSVG